MRYMKRFVDTLGFLTRLAPARVISEEEMNQCMAYMTLVGLVLGGVVVLPFSVGLFGSTPWIQAWLMVGISVYLTRGLHLDGLGDICDAVTTHASPELFWKVVKDSRSGAFAIIGLALALAGLILLYHEMAAAKAFGAIIWSFVLGRCASVWLAYTSRHLARPGLGKLYIDGATLKVTLFSSGAALFLGCLLAGPIPTFFGMVIAGIAVLPLCRLAEHVGGVNGDFLGCAIILGELSSGLGFALFL